MCVWGGGLEDTSADVQVVKIPEKWYGLPLFDYFHGLFDYPQGSIPVNLQHCPSADSSLKSHLAKVGAAHDTE